MFFNFVKTFILVLFLSNLTPDAFSAVKLTDQWGNTVKAFEGENGNLHYDGHVFELDDQYEANNLNINAHKVVIHRGSRLKSTSLKISCKELIINNTNIEVEQFLDFNCSRISIASSKIESPVQSYSSKTKDIFIGENSIFGEFIDLNFSGHSSDISVIVSNFQYKKSNRQLEKSALNYITKMPANKKANSYLAVNSKKPNIIFKSEVNDFEQVHIIGKGSDHRQFLEINEKAKFKNIGNTTIRSDSNLQIRGPITSGSLLLSADNRVKLFSESRIDVNNLAISGDSIELSGRLLFDDLKLDVEKDLKLNRLKLKGNSADIKSQGKVSLGYQAIVELNKFMELTSTSDVTLKGETYATVLKVVSGRDVECFGQCSTKSAAIEANDSTIIAGHFKVSPDGELKIKGDSTKLSSATIKGGDDQQNARDLDLNGTSLLNINNSSTMGFDNTVLKSNKEIYTTSNTDISTVELNIESPFMSLSGDFKAKTIQITGRNINYNGRIINADTVSFIGDKTIDIGTSAVLHVLRILDIKSNSRVNIKGDVVAKILQVAGKELNILKDAKLTVQQEALIYTSLWAKLHGIINFGEANTRITSTGLVEIDGELTYKNLEIKKPEQSAGQNLIVQIKNRSKIRHIKKLYTQSRVKNDSKDEGLSQKTNIDDPEAFADIVTNELSSIDWKDFRNTFFFHYLNGIKDDVIQSIFSGYLDIVRKGCENTGKNSLGEIISEIYREATSEKKTETLSKVISGGFTSTIEKLTGAPIEGHNLLEVAGLLGTNLLVSSAERAIFKPIDDPQHLLLSFIQLFISYPRIGAEGVRNKLVKDAISFPPKYKQLVLEWLGIELDQRQLAKNKSIFDSEDIPKQQERELANFESGNMVISADDVIINGAVKANNLKLQTGLFRSTGNVETQIAEILTDHFKLASSSSISIGDQAKIIANIDAMIEGSVEGKRMLVQNGSKITLSEEAEDTYIEIKANNILSSGNYSIDGELRLVGIGENNQVILEQKGRVGAKTLYVEADDAQISSKLDVENAYFNIFNDLIFDSVDAMVVKNYLKVYAPNSKIKIDSDIIAKVIDIAAEEFYLMRSGLLSAEEHAVIEAKVHMVLDGVINANNTVNLRSDDISITKNIRAKKSLDIAGKSIKVWQKSNLESEQINLDSGLDGTVELNDAVAIANKAMDIKANKFSLIVGSSLNGGSELNIRVSNAYLGKMTRAKADRINIKSKTFTQMALSQMKGTAININTDFLTSMGSIMAENIMTSSKLMTVGPLGSVLGSSISIDSGALVLAPLSAIAGVRVNTKTYMTTLSPGSAIVGGSVNLKSVITATAPFSAIAGGKVSVVSPVVFNGPNSSIAGFGSTSVDSFFMHNKKDAAITSAFGSTTITAFQGELDGTIKSRAHAKGPKTKGFLEKIKDKKDEYLPSEYLKTKIVDNKNHRLKLGVNDQTTASKPENSNENQKKTTFDSKINFSGQVGLGSSFQNTGTDVQISAGSLHTKKGSKAIGEDNVKVNIRDSADLHGLIQSNNSAEILGADRKVTEITLGNDAKVESKNQVRLSNLSKVGINSVDDHATFSSKNFNADNIGTFTTIDGTWLSNYQKSEVEAKTFNIGGQFTGDTSSNNKTTTLFRQEDNGQAFNFHGHGKNTKTTLISKSMLNMGNNKLGTSGGDELDVLAYEDVNVDQNAHITSDTNNFYIHKSLKNKGVIGTSDTKTNITDINLLNTTKDPNEANKSEFFLKEGASLNGQFMVSGLKKTTLAGELSTNSTSIIESDIIESTNKTTTILDAREKGAELHLVANSSMTAKGSGKTLGENEAKVYFIKEGSDSTVNFGYNHEEDNTTSITLNAKDVKLSNEGQAEVGGGKTFAIYANTLNQNNAHQHAKSEVTNTVNNDLALSGKITSEAVSISTKGALTSDSTKEMTVDLKNAKGPCSLKGKQTILDNISFNDVKGSGISLGDINSTDTVVNNIKVNGDSTTKTIITGTNRSSCDNSKLTSMVGVYTTGGSAHLGDSEVSGSAQVFGKTKTEIVNNTLDGDVRGGYLVQAGSNDKEKVTLVQTDNLTFEGNKSSQQAGKSKLSLAADKITENGNNFDNLDEYTIIANEINDDGHSNYSGKENKIVKTIKSSEGSATKVIGHIESYTADRLGNLTSASLSDEDRAHNALLNSFGETISKSIEAEEKNVVYSEVSGFVANAIDPKIVRIKENLKAIDGNLLNHLDILGEKFELSKDKVVEVKNFISEAQQNDIFGELLFENLARFIAKENDQSSKTVFHKGSKIESRAQESKVEIQAYNASLEGSTKFDFLNTKTNNITYSKTSETDVDKIKNRAEDTITSEGLRIATHIDDIAKNVKYASSSTNIIKEDGSLQVLSTQFNQEEGSKVELGKDARMIVNGLSNEALDGKAKDVTKDENQTEKRITNNTIDLYGSITGSEGSQLQLIGDYCKTKGLIDVEKTLINVDQLIHNGIIKGEHAALIALEELSGNGEVDVQSSLKLTAPKNWKRKRIKLKSGSNLYINLRPLKNDQERVSSDFTHLEAGDAIFLEGYLDSTAVKQLLSGKKRDSTIKTPHLKIKTTDPMIIFDKDLDVKFKEVSLEGRSFFLKRNKTIKTNKFNLEGDSFVQLSGSSIDSGTSKENNINIKTNDFLQVYDWDIEENKHINFEENSKEHWKPAHLSAGGNLKVDAHSENEDATFFSQGGQFKSRHGNIIIKSNGSLTMVPITYVSIEESRKYVKGSFGLRQKVYSIFRDQVAHNVKLVAKDQVSIHGSKHKDRSVLSGVEIDSKVEKLVNVAISANKLRYVKKKIGYTMSDEGMAVITAAKIAVKAVATCYLGPAAGAAVGNSFNTIVDIGINRCAGGLRTDDEWAIARKNAKNAGKDLVLCALSDCEAFKNISDTVNAGKTGAVVLEELARIGLERALNPNSPDGADFYKDMRRILYSVATDYILDEIDAEIFDHKENSWDKGLTYKAAEDLADNAAELIKNAVSNAAQMAIIEKSIDPNQLIENILLNAEGMILDNYFPKQNRQSNSDDENSLNENLSNLETNQEEDYQIPSLETGDNTDLPFGDAQGLSDSNPTANINEENPGFLNLDFLPPIIEEQENVVTPLRGTYNNDYDQTNSNDVMNSYVDEQSDNPFDVGVDERFNPNESPEDVVNDIHQDSTPEIDEPAAADPLPSGNEDPAVVEGYYTKEEEDANDRDLVISDTLDQIEKIYDSISDCLNDTVDQAYEIYVEFKKHNCFVPDTLVMVPEGVKKIGELTEGDIVISCDKNSLSCNKNVVTNVIWHLDQNVITVKTNKGDFKSTFDHRYYVKDLSDNHDYVEAQDLQTGDTIHMASGEYAKVLAIIDTNEQSDVVDITVKNDNNFFVSNQTLCTNQQINGLHVHNCSEAVANNLERVEGMLDKGLEMGVSGFSLSYEAGVQLGEFINDPQQKAKDAIDLAKNLADNYPDLFRAVVDEYERKYLNYSELSPKEQGQVLVEAINLIRKAPAFVKKINKGKPSGQNNHKNKNQKQLIGDSNSLPKFQSKSDAFRSAKRDLGIPQRQRPDAVKSVALEDKWGKKILDSNGKVVNTREYHFTRSDGSKVVVQEHSAGHKFGQGGVGDQGPHYNVRPYDATSGNASRNGSVTGTKDHYSY